VTSAAQRQGTIVKVPPEGHPLSVADAKRQLRIEDDDTTQDDHVATLIAAAHRKVENELGYPILRQTRTTHLFGFPCGPIWLGGGKGLSVGAVRYVDAAGLPQVLPTTDYIVDAVSRPATLCAAPTKTWPATQSRPGAVEIDWTAGAAKAADVDEDLIHAMKLLVGHWDQNREAVVIGTTTAEIAKSVDWLLEDHRIVRFA
jgi:uncharacterized phiE125 gp8 family phage protein